MDILYNQINMAASSEVMRALLLAAILGMALLAAFYLRRRQMAIAEYLLWGLIIVLLPLLGPFLVILARPGKPRHL
jgi:hypothetical protein